MELFGKYLGSKGIDQTLVFMKVLILESDHYRIVKETASSIIKGCSPVDYRCQITKIFEWVKNNFDYVRDINGVEEVTAPHIILHNIINGGTGASSDCDDFAVLLGALLRAVGFKVRV